MHAEPTTAAGLLLSLASSLPDPRCPLGREAARVADALSHGASNRGLQRRAADLTAALLDAVDTTEPEDDGLLCEEFDQ